MRTRVLILVCKAHRRRIGVIVETNGRLDSDGGEALHTPTGTRSFLFPCQDHGMMIAFETAIRRALTTGQKALELERLAPTFRASRMKDGKAPGALD